ncbi:glycoside hydrolase family 15 protein [Streptomyces tubbatahanensis]|uniref:Glycoside hydrolase family 15 protein n=1 Tax=Streptomyces tubbatahanensis TaxID=2923272 RepID=A0ABY3Y085_9ACTN|nr:glycoside hydrolase family 15 protein [Streptomyces tubbatahanensis]UNT00213.1 glycoside hydrolase family 15 protein [Streptomyces tubbatahanensis]
MTQEAPYQRRGGSGDGTQPWPLRDYAFLGDGERGALVSPRGELVWMCAPCWDSDAVFSRLIGGAGQYALLPDDDWQVSGGFYESGTLIRVSRWVTADAVLLTRDALALPATPERLVVLRRISVERGPSSGVGVRMCLDPRPDFGKAAMGAWRRAEEEPGPAGDPAAVWEAFGGGLRMRWSGAPEARPGADGALYGGFVLREGERRDLVLEIATERASGGGSLEPHGLWKETERRWRQSVPDCSDLLAPRDARQAYAVLTGLTSGAGGMVAAATTSLPEHAGEGRNYDYRYAWLRDQSYAGIAVAAHGPHPLLDSAVDFVTARVLADGDSLRPAYTVTGERVPDERSLGLSGYPGGSDRVGNKAGSQFQLDTFGEVLQLYAAAARHGHLDNPDVRRAVDVAVAAVERNWQHPEAGLWELEKRWWTHSRLSVVAGLRALSAQLPEREAGRHQRLAATVLEGTRARCLRSDGVWARAADDPNMDAGVLLPLARGCLPEEDPTTARTVAAVQAELAEDGYVYRFRHDHRPLAAAEGAFLLCGFMMSLAVDHLGDRPAAYRWFERNRGAYGPPTLYAEEFDVEQRQLRGNLPQGFVHALLLENAVRLAEE